MKFSGILYNTTSLDGSVDRAHLPLEGVKVKAFIVDVSARVTLTQIYSNPSGVATSRCKYYFPVPAGAAICAFNMRTSDGHTVAGIVKEKNFALREYEEAVRAGKFAGMLDYVTDDIFTISVGSIPAQATVETTLIYVLSLTNDDNADEVRFQLPMIVGERYGTPPELESALAPMPRTRIKIKAEIQTSGKIQSVTSPSHRDDISEIKYPTDIGRLSRRRSTVKYRSRSFLDRDFILIIQADGLDSPRCFAELNRDPGNKCLDTIAMQLTIVPKFDLPPISAQEYLFMVDRSGSMDGTRIETAKRTLNILLRMLPSQGARFNVFSFGNDVTSLWDRSRGYSQELLSEATTHIDSMQANYGATEICRAMEHVLRCCTGSMPAAVFVLTDGESHDTLRAISVIENAMQRSPPYAPLRVFTLGIGTSVSTAMCEGIARAGNGVCLFAVDTESILGKCARLFRAGRTPFVKNVTIDWGISSEYTIPGSSSVTFSNQVPSSSTIGIQSLPAVQQVPTQIHDIHAGSRTSVFVILILKKLNVPKAVTLRGQLDDGSGGFEMTVPIRGVQLRDTEPILPLIHTLAAWRLIQEHQENRAPLPPGVGGVTGDDMRKAVIVELGKRYQLTSQHTSFVAVDSGQNDTISRVGLSSYGEGQSRHRDTSRLLKKSIDSISQGNGYLGVIHSVLSGILGFRQNMTSSRGLPGEWQDPPPPSSPSSQADVNEESYESAETFSTLSSLDGSSQSSDGTSPPSPRLSLQLSSAEEIEQRGSSPRLEQIKLAPSSERRLFSPTYNALPMRPPAPPPVRQEVVDLIRLQSFDGSFALDDSLKSIVGMDAADEAGRLQVDSKVWATALSVAFITKCLGNQKELLGDLLAKAYDFLNRHNSINAERLVRRAKELVV